jgi:hypothetical protein
MPPVGLEPTISADERPHTYPLDRAATGTGYCSKSLENPTGAPEINSALRTPSADKVHSYNI